MESVFSNIKTVFFDLDNTLWWFEENSKVALRKTYLAFCRPSWACGYDDFADIYHKHNDDLWKRYSQGEIEVDFLKSERFRITLEEINGHCAEPLAKEMDSFYLDYLSSLRLLIPDAKYILEYLSKKGYELCILSNGFAGVQQRKLQNSGIARFFSHIVLSEDVGISKPQRGIFDAALQIVGRKPDEVVMIGDNAITDIQGAHLAGWSTIYFRYKDLPPIEGTADAEIKELSAIQALL